MVPLCYRSATVNGLKKPACILHAPYCDIQDANEMRMVENAKRNERHTGRIRETYGTIATSKNPPPLGMSSGGDLSGDAVALTALSMLLFTTT